MSDNHDLPRKNGEHHGEGGLPRRNNEAAMQAIAELNKRISGLHKIIMEQQGGMVAMTKRIDDLERRVSVQRAQTTGHGPTETKNGDLGQS